MQDIQDYKIKNFRKDWEQSNISGKMFLAFLAGFALTLIGVAVALLGLIIVGIYTEAKTVNPHEFTEWCGPFLIAARSRNV